MMKLGVVTFHDTANFGAALQAYATVEALRRAGHDAELLDYTNAYRRSIYRVLPRLRRLVRKGQIAGAVKTMAGAPAILRRVKRFDAFYRDHTPRSAPLRTRTALKRVARDYDAIIAGSDQIWNPRHNGGDTVYLLDFVDEPERMIAYASSFGAVNVAGLDRETYARCLSRIRALSVRERTGADLVRDLTGQDVPTVVDPVFLLTAEDWKQLASESGRREPPLPGLLDYTAKPGMLKSFLTSTGLHQRFRTVTRMGTAAGPLDCVKPGVRLAGSEGPLEFVRQLQHAELLLTSSFHGTALAILLRRPFVSVLSGNPGRDSRITDLLNGLGLSSRIFSPRMTSADVTCRIPFDEALSRQETCRQESLGFLTAALDSICPRCHA